MNLSFNSCEDLEVFLFYIVGWWVWSTSSSSSSSSSVISLSWVHRPKTWRMLHLWHRFRQLKATKLRSSDAGVGAGKKPCNFGRQRCLDGTEGSCERWDILFFWGGWKLKGGILCRCICSYEFIYLYIYLWHRVVLIVYILETMPSVW